MISFCVVTQPVYATVYHQGGHPSSSYNYSKHHLFLHFYLLAILLLSSNLEMCFQQSQRENLIKPWCFISVVNLVVVEVVGFISIVDVIVVVVDDSFVVIISE